MENMKIKHFALGIVNAYLVKTIDGVFMIDTGLAMSRSKLERVLRQEEVKPGQLKLVIITHGDVDHIGNCAWLQRQFGAKIAVHEADADQCRTGKTNFKRKRIASTFSKFFRRLTFAIVYKRVMKKYPFEPFEPDIMLTDEQDLCSMGFKAKVIYIPGHTPGSIGILTNKGDFFSGDTILNRKKPTFANIIENENELATSIRKIRTLNIKKVNPGHGVPFTMSKMIL